MIVTDLAHLHEQVALTPQMAKTIDFLARVAPQAATLPDGRVEIDGDAAYALVQSYTSFPERDVLTLEGHRRYIDVQYVAAGEEIIYWGFIDQIKEITMPFDASQDAWLGTLPIDAAVPLVLPSGFLAVLYPTDAHAPRFAVDAPGAVKKIVCKVAVA